MNLQEDYIVMLRASTPEAEGRKLSREEFLDENPGSWAELIKGGTARYVRGEGQALKADQAVRTLKVFQMCCKVKRRVAERMASEFSSDQGLLAETPIKKSAVPLYRRSA